MRLARHFSLLAIALLARHAGAQPQEMPKVEMPPPLTQEQQCLLNVAMFKFPVRETAPPPAIKPVLTEALRMDLSRRSVFASEDGASYYIVERDNLRGGTRWYGPIAAAELMAACSSETASTLAK
jgi:hypothetical protein